ncbi:hypothetical protein BDW66DRAFT_151234 [Aspergillus desertorum]
MPVIEEKNSIPRDFEGFGEEGFNPQWPNNARIAVSFVLNYEEGGERSILDGDAHSEPYLWEKGSSGGFKQGARYLNAEQDFDGAGEESELDIWEYTPEQEKEYIIKTLKVLKETHAKFPEIWEELGEEFLWSSEVYNDDLPYWLDLPWQESLPESARKGMLLIPYNYDCNDGKFHMSPGFGSSVAESYEQYLKNTFDMLHREGGKMMNIPLHTRIIGKPGDARHYGSSCSMPLKRKERGVRHIRCDESPGGQCQNCLSAGWQCEGYNDPDRLPRSRRHVQAHSPPTCIRDIETRAKVAWPMTADEQRSFSYFQHHSIVSLTALFESPLWQRHVLQMCHADTVVFYAVTMLSAAHQRSELQHMQRLQGTPAHRAYCFSLQQSSRAMRMLTARLSSQDPELRHVVLLCSLLFGLSDVLLERHGSAWTHFLSGLRILKEIEQRPDLMSKVEPSLVAVYRRISLQAALYSNKSSLADAPPAPVPTYAPPLPPKLEVFTCAFSSLAQLQSVLLGLLDTGIPLIATGLSLSDHEFRASYDSLYIAQSRLLCTFAQFNRRFNLFCALHAPTLPKSQQGALDLLRLLILGHILSLKIALIRRPLPLSFLPEVSTILEAHESYIANYRDRPTRVADHGVSANMYLLATRAPDLITGVRAVAVLRVWPRYVGFHSSTSAAPLARNVLVERFGAPEVDMGMSVCESEG